MPESPYALPVKSVRERLEGADGSDLAIEGGAPFISHELPTWPQIPKEGREAVSRVLESGKINYWTGSEAKLFEAEFAALLQVPEALAVANGTVALEIALRSFGIGIGDEVIVPSRTFIATAGAVANIGAVPIVADIDPATNALTPLTIAPHLTPRTRAVIVVHVGGYPAPVDEIRALTDQLDLVLIEDCAQAQNGTYHGRPLGTLGHASCFSFCQDKILPLGEGGMICYTQGERQQDAYLQALAYRDHGHVYGRTRSAGVQETSSNFRYLSDHFGTNARLTEAQGALGRAQLRYLQEYHRQRARNAQLLIEALAPFAPAFEPLTLSATERAAGSEQAWYRLYFRLHIKELKEGWTRNRVIDAIVAEGAPVQFGACALIGREQAFLTAGIPVTYPLPGAEIADAESVAFFVHPNLSEDDMLTIAAATTKVLDKAMAPRD